MTLPLNWSVRVHDDARSVTRRPAGRRRIGVVVLGVCAGALAAMVAGTLPVRAAPLALFIILLSTLLAGRFAPLGAALAHGACAWMVVAVTGLVTHRFTAPGHGIPALWLVLLLVEDMVLIGRIGHVRQLIAQQRH